MPQGPEEPEDSRPSDDFIKGEGPPIKRERVASDADDMDVEEIEPSIADAAARQNNFEGTGYPYYILEAIAEDDYERWIPSDAEVETAVAQSLPQGQAFMVEARKAVSDEEAEAYMSDHPEGPKVAALAKKIIFYEQQMAEKGPSHFRSLRVARKKDYIKGLILKAASYKSEMLVRMPYRWKVLPPANVREHFDDSEVRS